MRKVKEGGQLSTMPTQTTHKDVLCVVPRKVSLSDAPPPRSLLAARDFYYCFLLVHKTSTGLHQTQRYCGRPSVDWLEYYSLRATATSRLYHHGRATSDGVYRTLKLGRSKIIQENIKHLT